MLDGEDRRAIFAFLDGCATEIEDFSQKVDKNGFLRLAISSHLKRCFCLTAQNAHDALNTWIENGRI